MTAAATSEASDGSATAVATGSSAARWLVWVSFDGTDFHGFARQAGERTVAGTLEAAWAAWIGEAIVVRGSSRTDAGVHARRLPLTLTTARTLPAKALVRGWSAALPDDVAVLAVEPVDAAFDVRHDCIGKRYVYRLWNAPTRAPLLRRDHLHVKTRLALAPMQAAAALLQGDHDYAAFRSVSCQSRSTRRTLHRVEVRQGDEPGVVAIVVEGNAFLHNMVRILAGTLIAVGKGRMAPEQVAIALQSGRRQDAGPTAPPHGLTLDEVFYGPFGARQGLQHKELLQRLAAHDPEAGAGARSYLQP